VCAILTGCTTYQPTSPEDARRIAATIRPGDIVTCTLRNGVSRSVKVAAFESGWLIGEPNSVFVGDAVRIEIRSRAVDKIDQYVPLLVLAGATGYLAAHPPVLLPGTN
jgi:hypothetical protein